MTTYGTNNMTLADAAKLIRADGREARVAEMMSQQLSLVTDMEWREGDTANGHAINQRDSLPTFSTRNPNGETAASKSTVSQYLLAPECIEAWSNLDEKVAEYGGNVQGKRVKEAKAFMEAAKQTVANRIIYGNGTTTPGQINGLAKLFNSLSGNIGRQVIDGGAAGGQTDCQSIYLLVHGDGFYGWYPKGTQAGLKVKDWGARPVTTSTGISVKYQEQWMWDFGVGLEDYRQGARIASIDTSALVAGSGADLFDKLALATHTIYDLSMGRPALYMTRNARAYLDIQARADVIAGGGLTYDNVGGKQVSVYRGIVINLLEQLAENEGVVA